MNVIYCSNAFKKRFIMYVVTYFLSVVKVSLDTQCQWRYHVVTYSCCILTSPHALVVAFLTFTFYPLSFFHFQGWWSQSQPKNKGKEKKGGGWIHPGHMSQHQQYNIETNHTHILTYGYVFALWNEAREHKTESPHINIEHSNQTLNLLTTTSPACHFHSDCFGVG